MSLPDSRNTTYTPATKIKSTDLNDLQDAVAAAAHGAIFDVWHPFACSLGANVTKNVAGYLAFSAAGDAHLAPKATTGDRIASFLGRVYGNGVTTFAVNVWVMDASGVLTNICPGGVAATLTPAAAWTDLPINLVATTLGVDQSLYISIETSGGGARLGNISIGNNHPL